MIPAKEDLLEWRRQGMSNIEIAQKLGRSYHSVTNYFRHYGLGRGNPTPQEKIDAIVQMSRSGKSAKEISKETGCGLSTVYIYREAAGAPKETNLESNSASRLELPEMFIMAKSKKPKKKEHFLINGRMFADVTYEFCPW